MIEAHRIWTTHTQRHMFLPQSNMKEISPIDCIYVTCSDFSNVTNITEALGENISSQYVILKGRLYNTKKIL